MAYGKARARRAYRQPELPLSTCRRVGRVGGEPVPTPAPSVPQIFGIVNVTRDSFSDGGLAFEPQRAIERALFLMNQGAHAIDLGAASSHPDAENVAPAEEIRRLQPVLPPLLQRGIPVSLDSYAPEVQAWGAGQGVSYLNDIHGFPDAATYPLLSRFAGRLIVMHSIQASGKATRVATDPREMVRRITDFFSERVRALVAAGVARERLILDPGMGFFLGTDPEASLAVLRALPELRATFRLPLLVSVSRKSFIGALTGKEPKERGAGTLAAELFATEQGVDFIRTHDVGALRDALRVWRAAGGTHGALPGQP